MRNAMRLLVVILILGIVMTNVAYASTGLEMNSAQANRKMILRVPVGDNEREIGYSGSEQFGYMGPDSFAVEGEKVYILDSVNNRILVYASGTYLYEI